jgi:hypothetical protein
MCGYLGLAKNLRVRVGVQIFDIKEGVVTKNTVTHSEAPALPNKRHLMHGIFDQQYDVNNTSHASYNTRSTNSFFADTRSYELVTALYSPYKNDFGKFLVSTRE